MRVKGFNSQDHDIRGMPKNACEDRAIGVCLRFTTYEYDSVMEKHFAHARMYDPMQGRMFGIDPVKRGLNGYAYCGNDPVNQSDPTGSGVGIPRSTRRELCGRHGGEHCGTEDSQRAHGACTRGSGWSL